MFVTVISSSCYMFVVVVINRCVFLLWTDLNMCRYLLLTVVILAITNIYNCTVILVNILVHIIISTSMIINIISTIMIITFFATLNHPTILFQHLISSTIFNHKNYLAFVINVNIKFILLFIYSSYYIFTLLFTGL